MIRAFLLVTLALSPRMAEACATCISSAYGDRTYSWPYLGLILLPFAVAAVIGGVLARVNGVRLSTLRRRITGLVHPAARQEETT